MSNTIGNFNSAVGSSALVNNITGSANTATGASALQNNTGGTNNTAVGNGALLQVTSGNFNIAIGAGAGNALSGNQSNNIRIGSNGTSTDNNTICIGIPGSQASFFAVGFVASPLPTTMPSPS